MEIDNAVVGVIGLGYVGLPLAVEFGKKYRTIGFDINKNRLDKLKQGRDETLEVSDEELKKSEYLSYTVDLKVLKKCNVYIITVPTPINENNQPDLTPLIKASETVGAILSQGDVVIYESTVYPGATEEDCVPVLENTSGLIYNKDFYCGYSPERINPGDKTHRVTSILKVTSGSTEEVADYVDRLYGSIIKAGTHKASSIKVAEASKVIENTQRDLNIALINELAIIFNKLGIDTEEVLQAAGTKWNFLPFRPGLVGGHCIGVDPYYLTHKSQMIGHTPDVILAGRRINSGMGEYIANQLIKTMLKKCINVSSSKVLVLGFTFKENCPDIRNTRVIDVVRALEDVGILVDIHDPWINKQEVGNEYGLATCDNIASNFYDAVIIAVSHDKFQDMGLKRIKGFLKETSVIYDVKSMFSQNLTDLRL